MEQDKIHNPASYEEWDMKAALREASAIKDVGQISYADQTRHKFDEAAPAAAQQIINIALWGLDERRKLDAAKYIVDRVLGRIGEEKMADGKENPLEAMLGDVVRQAENLTR